MVSRKIFTIIALCVANFCAAWSEDSLALIAELSWQQLNSQEKQRLAPTLGTLASSQRWHDLFLAIPNQGLANTGDVDLRAGHNWFARSADAFDWSTHCADNDCLAARQWQAWQDVNQQPLSKDSLAPLLFYSSRLAYPMSAGLQRDQGGRLIILGSGQNSRNLAWIWQHGLLQQRGQWPDLAANWQWQSDPLVLEDWSREQLQQWVTDTHQLALTLYQDAFNSTFNAGYVRRHRQRWQHQIERAVQLNLALLRLAWAENLADEQ